VDRKILIASVCFLAFVATYLGFAYILRFFPFNYALYESRANVYIYVRWNVTEEPITNARIIVTPLRGSDEITGYTDSLGVFTFNGKVNESYNITLSFFYKERWGDVYTIVRYTHILILTQNVNVTFIVDKATQNVVSFENLLTD
jgi:hypothetical protein